MEDVVRAMDPLEFHVPWSVLYEPAYALVTSCD